MQYIIKLQCFHWLYVVDSSESSDNDNGLYFYVISLNIASAFPDDENVK